MNCVGREPKTGPWGPLTSGCCGEEEELVMEEESPGPWPPSRESTGEEGGQGVATSINGVRELIIELVMLSIVFQER